jgi:hypothetical protein
LYNTSTAFSTAFLTSEIFFASCKLAMLGLKGEYSISLKADAREESDVVDEAFELLRESPPGPMPCLEFPSADP